MQNIEIRRPKIADFEDLSQFFRIVITDTYIREGIGHLLDDIEKEIDIKQKYLNLDIESNGENRYFLLAVINNQVIGSIEYGPVSNLISELTNNSLKEVVEVGTVYVHPDFQDIGIGTLLLNVMYLTLKNKGIEDFCLDSGYKRAQKIWTNKFGEPDYLIKDYWSQGFHHMIWRRSISEMEIKFKI
ncbi:GNAT family N-acetyltransferase [Bacillus sp. RG28]|uniref:GNAT family N-acetyltransferase n=1 Tax=Gottfriedia endophytica TaxID=2820819 RepID=A0A940SKP8_9BACI|nr:GNAT family N-acetyltransferase [Gottfriedia endophytica]MBP0726676.1 GNAT family N-acetyltransferase [Gottfriedia endophytica]